MQKLRLDESAPIGVLMFESAGDRIIGDPGMPGTFPFPIRYGIVPGSYRDLIHGSPQACERLCTAAQKLEQEGVAAIAGDCGLMALYQSALAESVQVPVISSSLVLLPLAQCLIGKDRKIGIITGHSQLLSEQHLLGANADPDRLVIQGMEEQPHFRQVVLEGSCPQDYQLMARDVLHAVKLLLEREEAIGAILLECSNLTTFAREVSKHYSLPVLDVNLAIQMLYLGRNHTDYQTIKLGGIEHAIFGV